jgi:putative peptidoglycan lipid II flippase
MLYFGDQHGIEWLAVDLAWGSVAGSFLQFAVQAPFAFSLSRHPGRHALSAPVRQAMRNFVPILVSRGAVQLTAFIDSWIASWLPTGAVAALGYAQLLYTLPISLFGISISAAELPAMSGDAAGEGGFAALRSRINAALERMAFFVIPSAVAFVALGDVIAGALLQRGRFEARDSVYVWGILAGSSVGMLASTMARLYSVAHYAIGDAKKPLRYAAVRLVVVTALGYVCALVLPPKLGIAPGWGAAGLTASAGVAGWIEFALLRASFNRRAGSTGLSASYSGRVWLAGIVGAAVAWIVKLALPPLDPMIRGALVLPAFGAAFLGAAVLLRIEVPGLRRRRR